jgi:putative endonuclease
MKVSYVYILAGASRVLYVGVTSDLERRVAQHKAKLVSGFVKKYNVTELVYFEVHGDIRGAIAREKQIKGWRRSKKTDLITANNPTWKDLGAGWKR